MVEDGAYCVDILTQIQAVRSALGAVGHRILQKHIEHCVVDAVESKNRADIDDKISEIIDVLKRNGK